MTTKEKCALQQSTYSVPLWVRRRCSANLSICRKSFNSRRILAVITRIVTQWDWVAEVLCNCCMTTA